MPRPRLLERLRAGLHSKLTLISAPAGFGKTTLLGAWLNHLRFTIYDLRFELPSAIVNRKSEIVNPEVAWLALDAGDSDPARFLAYLVAALQTAAPAVGAGVLRVLQAPQPPPVEALLTMLLNEIAALPAPLVLVLDDYHVLESQPIDQALAFLIEHLPPQLRLVVATREDPQLPLARLRAHGQLTELRAADLRFTLPEATEFLNQVMGLSLAPAAIAALEARTEGWVAGLQLAAISLQGQPDTAGFIESFTGSHHFVLDYLLEEVLHRQPAHIQAFLLHTAILERMCGPLCDHVLGMKNEEWSMEHSEQRNSQFLLEELERANLFLVPLDSERRWFRYHHLFADLLRQRLRQSLGAAPGGADAAIRAPNIEQGWRFILVDDPAIMAQLAPLYRQGFERMIGGSIGDVFGPLLQSDAPMARMVRSGVHLVEHFHEVPLLLIGFGRTREGSGIYPALWSAMLAARAEGVGSTLTGMLQSFFANEVCEILGVPQEQGWAMHGVVTMGYPTGKWGVGARKPVHEVAARNSWQGELGFTVPEPRWPQ